MDKLHTIHLFYTQREEIKREINFKQSKLNLNLINVLFGRYKSHCFKFEFKTSS